MAIGIANLSALAVAVGATATNVDKILEGGIGADDVTKIPGLFMNIASFFGIKYDQLKAEIDDLDDGEKADLAHQFQAAFDLRADTVEALIEKGIEIIMATMTKVSELIELLRKIKNKEV